MEGSYQPLHLSFLFLIINLKPKPTYVMNTIQVLDSLTPEDRELVEMVIEREIEDAVKEERKAIVKHLYSRVSFWSSNSNVNKAIQRVAKEIEQKTHLRLQNDE